jgi:hypothetical protein
MPRGGPPKPLGQVLPGATSTGASADAASGASPLPSDNLRYQQLKQSGPKYRRTRQSRGLARQKVLRHLDVAGDRINSRAPYPDEIAYITTFLINATLPLQQPPKGTRLWTRRFQDKRGLIAVTFEAGSEHNPDGTERCFGLPYGIYPRLILSWLISEALTTKKRVLTLVSPDPFAPRHVARSFSAWMRDGLGVIAKGGAKGSITLLREQMTRLFNLKITLTINGKETRFRILPIKGDRGFFDPALEHGAKPTAPIEIVIDEDFFHQILVGSCPTHLGVQKELATLGACLALDLYRFLSLKQFAMQKAQAVAPMLIPWKQLQEMFGHSNKRASHFREAIIDALELVLTLYPDAKAEACPGGLRIRPSRPHIQPTEKSPRTIAAASQAALAASSPTDALPDPERGS